MQHRTNSMQATGSPSEAEYLLDVARMLKLARRCDCSDCQTFAKRARTVAAVSLAQRFGEANHGLVFRAICERWSIERIERELDLAPTESPIAR